MRQRHILLRRQRSLQPRLLRSHPLATYIARRRILATTLGLRTLDSAWVDVPNKRVLQPWWPLPADRFSIAEEEPAVGRIEENEREFVLQVTHTTRLEEPGGPYIEMAEPGELENNSEELGEPEKISEVWGEPDTGLAEPEAGDVLQPIQPTRNMARIPPDPAVKPHVAEAGRASAQPSTFREKPEKPARRGIPAPGFHSRIAEFNVASEKLPPFSLAEESAPETGQERILPAPTRPPVKQPELVLPAPTHAPVKPAEPEFTSAEGQRDKFVTEELFAPRDVDRSPQAWLVRLTRQTQEEARARQPPARVVEPIAPRARTFLRPLLGIDPASVPVYRDAQAERATTAERADALSDGATIEMAPGHAEETPELLGLLAHELTHVARQQRPRFIPPVIRSTASTSTGETRDEEKVALQVERQVRQIARSEQPALAPVGISQPASVLIQSADGEIIPHLDRGIWGNLPAPWEPLPEWLAPARPPANQMASGQPVAQSPVAPAPVPAQVFATSEASSEGDVGKRRAGVERSVEEPGGGETSAPQSAQAAPEPSRTPEPDLDTLARQVYGLLKRRLSVEQRRGQ